MTDETDRTERWRLLGADVGTPIYRRSQEKQTNWWRAETPEGGVRIVAVPFGYVAVQGVQIVSEALL